ncbi:hypothetical protein TGRUB_258080B, partial [Toxoplasma gondii RUB]
RGTTTRGRNPQEARRGSGEVEKQQRAALCELATSVSTR